MLNRALSLLVFAASITAAAAQVPYPTPTSREKTIWVPEINYTDVLGRPASLISNIHITIIEESIGNGTVKTHFVADYSIYNYTWYKQGTWSIRLDVKDAAGNVIAPRALTLPIDRNSCTYGGPRQEHLEGFIAAPVYNNAQSAGFGDGTIIGRYAQPC